VCNEIVGGTVDVPTLCQIITKRVREIKTSPDELKDAFQVFDKQGTGMISIHDLKLSLTTLGERLTEEELDELIREVDQDGEGMVNYTGIVNKTVNFTVGLVRVTFCDGAHFLPVHLLSSL
jgi:calmodulin